MDRRRVKSDLEYVFLNMLVNKIPCWYIRRFFYRISGMEIGKGARIGIGTVIVDPRGIKIGENGIVNEFCHLDGRGGLSIGKNTSISMYTAIITAGHDKDSKDFKYRKGKTKIGNNVWIGTRAIILENSDIADFAVIGAGCVFKGKAEEKEIYIGGSKKLVGKRKIDNLYEINYKPYFR